ncbi:hypothetical protein QAD02_002718 [Eretmocerus hayati]|uniref:Uncharacterized protein n=1 Tax=Eretmocerus hayati TaxID=131215 RepID=A0ACC2NK16_9HYME|nr:hypothetical protein QAD02_002718 [Eretmocerus hayati]
MEADIEGESNLIEACATTEKNVNMIMSSDLNIGINEQGTSDGDAPLFGGRDDMNISHSLIDSSANEMIPVNGTEEKTVGDSIGSVAPNGNMEISDNVQLLEQKDMESLPLVGTSVANENITTDHTKKITTDVSDSTESDLPSGIVEASQTSDMTTSRKRLRMTGADMLEEQSDSGLTKRMRNEGDDDSSETDLSENDDSINNENASTENNANDGIAIVDYNFKGLGRGDASMFDGSEIVVGLKGQISHTLRILFSERSKHYMPILNIFQATGSQGYCIPRNKSYRYANEHKCPDKCSACSKTPKCTKSDMIKCDKC